MSLFLSGGGPAEAPADAFDSFAAEAAGRGGSIALVLAGGDPEEYAGPLRERLPEAEFHVVWLGGDAAWPDDLAGLGGLVVGQGHVSDYASGLAPKRDQLAAFVRGGGPYLGFAAGAECVGKQVLLGGWLKNGRQVAPDWAAQGLEELAIGEGLGVVGPLVVAHADTYLLLAAAAAALRDADGASAVALDESACLAVDAISGKTRSLGPGHVQWLAKLGDAIAFQVL
jgi:hypothetical protein